jgi:hypothetical protein
MLFALPHATRKSVTAAIECMPSRPQAACRHVFDFVHGYGDSVFDACTCFPPSRDCARCQPGRTVARAQFRTPNDFYAFSRVLRLESTAETHSEADSAGDDML